MSSLIRVFTVCYSICISKTKYCKVLPLCLNFRQITAKICGVPKFRNFTVVLLQEKYESCRTFHAKLCQEYALGTPEEYQYVLNMSQVMRKPFFAFAKTKAQISLAITAKLISAFFFRYTDSTIPLLLKSKISLL